MIKAYGIIFPLNEKKNDVHIGLDCALHDFCPAPTFSTHAGVFLCSEELRLEPAIAFSY